MYKVSYYFTGSRVAFKWFKTFAEACEFSMKVPTGDVIEIKLYKDVDESSVNH
jgi:hypothetical protein